MIRLKDLIDTMEDDEGIMIRLWEQAGKRVYKGCMHSIPEEYNRGLVKHTFISATKRHIVVSISIPEPLSQHCKGCDNDGICSEYCGYIPDCYGCNRESCTDCKYI